MSRETGKTTIEVPSDTVIWGCDQCGTKVELAKPGGEFTPTPPPPNGWIALRISDGTEAMYVIDDRRDFCGGVCTIDWINTNTPPT